MNAYQKLICNLFCIILGFNLFGCAPAPLPADGIDAIHHVATISGIESALAGEPGTFILRSALNWLDDTYIIGWHSQGGWNFVVVDAKMQTPVYWKDLTGQVTTPANLDQFVRAVKDELKFERVNCKDAAHALYQGMALAESWLYRMASSELLPIFTISGALDLHKQFLPPAGEYE